MLCSAALAIAAALGSDAGYVEDGSFTRLREVAATINLPDRFARRAGVTGTSITFAGRNLKTWTNYTGLDPEVTSTPNSNFASSDFLTVPPVRYFIARLNLSF